MKYATLLTALLLSGCATLVTGTRDTVSLQSNPDGALVMVEGEMRGTTPTELSLASDQEHRIELVKEGYDRADVLVTYKTTGWTVFGNLFCCGLLPGVLVDAATGGAHTLRQESVFVNLRRGEASPFAAEVANTTPEP